MADARVRRARDDPGVNPTLARTLVALTYPLRLAAHLTQPSAPTRRAQVVVLRTDAED
jgi:hypothetical protein